jgi:hypothetical protein
MNAERSAATPTTQECVDRVVPERAPHAAGRPSRMVELLRPALVPASQPDPTDVTVRHAYGCTHCESRWDGLKTAHCSACHETFTTPGVFDKHRREGNCLPPQEAGLVLTSRAYRCWATPRRPEMVWQSRSERLSVPPKANGP